MPAEVEPLRERADRFRELAARAGRLAEALSGFLEPEVRTATSPGLWSGTWPHEATARLVDLDAGLRQQAEELTFAARRWLLQAAALDDQVLKLLHSGSALGPVPAGSGSTALGSRRG